MEQDSSSSCASVRARFAPLTTRTTGILLAAALATPLCAQWPTSYTEPRVLSAGAGIRAGHVMATPDGGVIASCGTTDGTTHGLHMAKYDAAGTLTVPGTPHTQPGPAVKIQILPPITSGNLCNLVTQFAPVSMAEDAFTGAYQHIQSDGHFTFAQLIFRQIFQAVTTTLDGAHHMAMYNPWNAQVTTFQNMGSAPTTPISLDGQRAKEFSMCNMSSGRSLVSFTKHSPLPDVPQEVWLYSYDATPSPAVHGPLNHVQNQGRESQSKPGLVNIGSNKAMVTWIGSINNTNRLYAKIVNEDATEAVAGRPVLQDVVDYITTSSTLGVPVIAGVQRAPNGITPDILFAGLIDGVNGVALTLPMVIANGVKVKDLRQEDNGDFSLTYSVPEAGTNLLKVRRISGTTAGTLWETTVADLGIAPDHHIEQFPNTFVSGGDSGALYIMSRKDQPNDMASFALARLRSDGHLGADALIAPTNLTAVIGASDGVELTWTDNSNSETHYIVGRTLTDFSGVQILATLPANFTIYTDYSAESNTTYRYYVAAYQSNTGNYQLSNEAQITVTAP